MEDAGAIAQATTSETIAGGYSADAAVRPVSPTIRDVLKSPWWQTRILVVYDVLIASLSVAAGFWLTPYYGAESGRSASLSLDYMVPVIAGSFVLASLAAGLYERKYIKSPLSAVVAAPVAAACAWGILLLVNYFITYAPVGRWIVVIGWAELSVASVMFRMLFQFMSDRSSTNVLLVGDEQGAQLIQAAARNLGDTTIRVAETIRANGCSITSTVMDLGQWVARTKADVVVVEDGCRPELLEQAVECVREGTWVSDFVWYFENTFEKVPVEKINLNWLISAHLHLVSRLGRTAKRASDMILGLMGLIVTVPIWPVIALLIKATSQGPVFYRQERVGRNGKPFVVIKFRTMCDGAENGKAMWAREHDDRVTLVGHFLRKSRLDEIPQFLNVLKGDMAFIGPRPERPEFVEQLARKLPHYRLRHLVKPGITGWAQIMYPYGASESAALEKLRYDLFYVKYGDLMLDLRILIRTVGAMMKGSR